MPDILYQKLKLRVTNHPFRLSNQAGESQVQFPDLIRGVSQVTAGEEYLLPFSPW